jgi:hypothetical protein
MKKQDLKNGMIVETRAGEKGVIIKDNVYGEDAVIFNDHNWTALDGFDNDLIWHNKPDRIDFCKTVDICKVYEPDLPTGFIYKQSKFSDLKLLWERKDVPEYTLNQLFKKLGHEFKIIS